MLMYLLLEDTTLQNTIVTTYSSGKSHFSGRFNGVAQTGHARLVVGCVSKCYVPVRL